MTEIITLGCGGGRHQTVDQTFKTGGFRIHDEDTKLHVDPGPGAILLTNKFGLDPEKLDAVLVSHAHPDHYTDAEVLIGAMKNSSGENGKIIGSGSVLEGQEGDNPVISNYHKEQVRESIVLKSGETDSVEDVQVEATPAKHTDSTTIGFKIRTRNHKIGYTSDTELFDELYDKFSDVDILIGNVTRPWNKRIDHHLCSEDFSQMLGEIKPDLGIMIHFGMLFLRNAPKDEKARIEDKTGVRTIPGFAGTKISISDNIKVRGMREEESYQKFY